MKNTLLIFMAVILLCACKTTGLKIGNLDVGKFIAQGENLWNANNISQDQEIQFGENMAAVLLGVQPLHQNVALNNYVNNIGMWLVSNTDRPDLPWQFGVIDSNAVNAFAAPGGFIFITSAMVEKMSSEAELAAVLAHEMVHVLKQHHLQAIKSGALRGALTETLFLSASTYQANTGAEQKERQYTEWAKKITGAAQEIYSRGLDKADEFEADQLGIRLLAKAGYDPFAFISNLQLLEGLDPNDSGLALMYKTHPTPTERLAMLDNQLEKLNSVQGQTLTERFNSIVY